VGVWTEREYDKLAYYNEVDKADILLRGASKVLLRGIPGWLGT